MSQLPVPLLTDCSRLPYLLELAAKVVVLPYIIYCCIGLAAEPLKLNVVALHHPRSYHPIPDWLRSTKSRAPLQFTRLWSGLVIKPILTTFMTQDTTWTDLIR